MDKIELVVDRIEDLKEHTSKRLDSIDYNLAEHMRRTDLLEQLHKDNAVRIGYLEKPYTFLSMLKQISLWIAAISSVVIAIFKIMEYIK